MQEIQKEDNLRYRSKVFCSKTMGHGDPNEVMYWCNAKMLEEDASLGKIYPCIEYKPHYFRTHWKEAVPTIRFGPITIDNNELGAFDARVDDGRLICYLFPPTESIYMYDTTFKTEDTERSRVKRNFTFGYSDDLKITMNPYSTVPVFDFSPVFFQKGHHYTMGLSSQFKRLKLIQEHFLFYADVLMEPIFGRIRVFSGAQEAKFMHTIASLLGKNVEQLVYDEGLATAFSQIILNSDVMTYYGSNIFESEKKKAYLEKYANNPPNMPDAILKINDFDASFYGITLYYMDEFDHMELSDKIIEQIPLDLSDVDKKKIRLAVYIVWIVNQLNSGYNDVVNSTADEEFDRKTFDDSGRLKRSSEYYQLSGKLEDTLGSAESVFVNALMLYRLLELGTTGVRTHKAACLSEYPRSGKIYSIGESTDLMELEDMSCGVNAEGMIVKNKYTRTNANDVSGKSIIFTIPSEFTNMRIFLLGARGLTYTTDSCRLYFEKVMVSIDGKTIVFGVFESENTPYYICHYIHSYKDNQSQTCSAVRLEFGPDLNVPVGSALLKDENNKGVVLNSIDNRFIGLCSTIFYIPVKYFRMYSFESSPITKGKSRLLASASGCNFEMQVTRGSGIHVSNVTSGTLAAEQLEEKKKQFVDIPGGPSGVLRDKEFDDKFKDFADLEDDEEEEEPKLMSEAAKSIDFKKPKSNNPKKTKKISKESILDTGKIGNTIVLDATAVEEFKKDMLKNLLEKKDKD